jgi:hypothetical protein
MDNNTINLRASKIKMLNTQPLGGPTTRSEEQVKEDIQQSVDTDTR